MVEDIYRYARELGLDFREVKGELSRRTLDELDKSRSFENILRQCSLLPKDLKELDYEQVIERVRECVRSSRVGILILRKPLLDLLIKYLSKLFKVDTYQVKMDLFTRIILEGFSEAFSKDYDKCIRAKKASKFGRLTHDDCDICLDHVISDARRFLEDVFNISYNDVRNFLRYMLSSQYYECIRISDEIEREETICKIYKSRILEQESQYIQSLKDLVNEIPIVISCIVNSLSYFITKILTKDIYLQNLLKNSLINTTFAACIWVSTLAIWSRKVVLFPVPSEVNPLRIDVLGMNYKNNLVESLYIPITEKEIELYNKRHIRTLRLAILCRLLMSLLSFYHDYATCKKVISILVQVLRKCKDINGQILDLDKSSIDSILSYEYYLINYNNCTRPDIIIDFPKSNVRFIRYNVPIAIFPSDVYRLEYVNKMFKEISLSIQKIRNIIAIAYIDNNLRRLILEALQGKDNRLIIIILKYSEDRINVRKLLEFLNNNAMKDLQINELRSRVDRLILDRNTVENSLNETRTMLDKCRSELEDLEKKLNDYRRKVEEKNRVTITGRGIVGRESLSIEAPMYLAEILKKVSEKDPGIVKRLVKILGDLGFVKKVS